MLKQNVPLSPYSHYKIGGPAEYLIEVGSTDQLVAGLEQWHKLDKREKKSDRIIILGGATNVLIDDEGLRGLTIVNRIDQIEAQENKVWFGGGLDMVMAVDYCATNSLSGFEWAGGLPGSVGGAVRGNAGAFKGETKDNILAVESVNLDTAEKSTREKGECKFDYRQSVFKHGTGEREMVTRALFEFKPGDKIAIKNAVQEKIQYREDHQPLEYPNIGSTFKNVDLKTVSEELKNSCADVIKTDPFPVIPVAHLLSEAGLKGRRAGGAMISPKHPNFIVNLGDATAEDVLKLINEARRAVKEQFNVDIETEIVYLKY